MEEKKIWFKNSRGEKLSGILYIPNGKKPRPAVVLIPGLNSNKSHPSYIQLSKKLQSKGIVALSIDAYGHGESSGVFEDVTVTSGVESIVAALDYLENLDYVDKNRLGIFGTSYGGAAAIAAASIDKRVKVLALKCPVSNYKDTRLRQLGKEGIKKWKKNGVTVVKGLYKQKWSFYQDLLDNHPNQYTQAEKIKILTLIVQGDEDQTVPLKHSKELYKHLKGKRKLEIIKGAEHRFETPPGAFEKVLEVSLNWFVKYL